MLNHIIGFIVDFFTNLNAKKILGAILAVAGLALLNRIPAAGNTNVGMLYGVAGLLIGGVGLVIIYFDIAKDKINGNFSELDTVDKALKQQTLESKKAAPWNMHGDPGKAEHPSVSQDKTSIKR